VQARGYVSPHSREDDPSARLELVRFAAQPSKGPPQRLEHVQLALRSQPMTSNEVGHLGEIEGQAEALGDRPHD